MNIRLNQNRRAGVAVLLVLTLLSLMLIYITANARTIYNLGRELKLIERQQLQHWAAQGARTNSVAGTVATQR